MRKIIDDHENDILIELSILLIHITNFSLHFFKVIFYTSSSRIRTEQSEMERLFVKNIFMLIATHFCSLSTAHVNVLCCRQVVHFHSHFPRMWWGKYMTKNTLMCDSWKCLYSRNFTAVEMCLSLLKGLVSFSVCWFTRILFPVMCLFRLGGWKIGDGIPGNVFLSLFFFYIHCW